jgi:hypothetical protein
MRLLSLILAQYPFHQLSLLKLFLSWSAPLQSPKGWARATRYLGMRRMNQTTDPAVVFTSASLSLLFLWQL